MAGASKPAWPAGDGNYFCYLASEGQLRGAYDRREPLGFPGIIYVPLDNRGVYAAPSSMRVGISFDC